MDESVFQQPNQEQLKQFVAGDPLAMEEVVELVLPQLINWSARHYPSIHEHERISVIHDVLLETCGHHERYNPNKAMFTTYVIGLIEKRMKTTQRKLFTLMDRENSLETVSENLSQTTYDTTEEDVVRRLNREEFYRLARSHLTPLEAEFLNLMREGEIHNPPFIDILRRSSNTNVTEREIKNIKERVKYKLETFARSRGLRLEDYL